MRPDPELSRAVLIGVSAYRTLNQVPAARSSVSMLARRLADPAVWGLPVDNCEILVDPRSTDDVKNAIYQASRSAEDALVIYFVGHGLLDRKGELYLGLPDADAGVLHHAVQYSEIRRMVIDADSRAKVVILDCCFSGAAADQVLSVRNDIAHQAAIDGAYLMTASAGTELALAPAGEKFTAFTGALIGAIDEGVPGASDPLDMDTLFEAVQTRLRSRDLPVPQRFSRGQGSRIALVRNAASPGKGVGRPLGANWRGAAAGAAPNAGAAPKRGGATNSRPRVLPRRATTIVTAAALSVAVAIGATVTYAKEPFPWQDRNDARPTSRPSDSTAASASPRSPDSSTSPSVAPTTAPTTDPTPTTTARPGPTGTTAPAPAPATGNVISPADGSDVQTCAYFSGTASLPEGKTLILAKRNISNGSPNRFVEYVFGWNEPTTLSTWRGAQYFGNGEDSVGQRYKVELMAVDLSAARAAKTDSEVNQLASQGQVLDALVVDRVTGSAPNDCEGP